MTRLSWLASDHPREWKVGKGFIYERKFVTVLLFFIKKFVFLVF